MKGANIVVLAGGVGGARLAEGLSQDTGLALTVIVNTADDFRHLGLHISPDIDTVLYTLAGIANEAQGWGIADESWTFLDQLQRLGAPNWFRLGDRDLAIHVIRTERMKAGASLTNITADLARKLGVRAQILPMTDSTVQTIVNTPDGEIPFQDYFVRLRCEPTVSSFRFAGIEVAVPTAEVLAALANSALDAIVVAPSNPFVSIQPILSLPGLRDKITSSNVPVIGVSPIIGGKAVKGPAAKMMAELGSDVSPLGIARHYNRLLTGFMIDHADLALKPEIEKLGIRVAVTDILMRDGPDRARLAGECLRFAELIRGSPDE
jgi:LPPG:FO 2-phospho-L-lactate transferase